MNNPAWLKPGLIGAVTGGVLVALTGFVWAGWTTITRAGHIGQAMADQQVIAALVPVCVERAGLDSDRMGKLAIIRQATGTGQRDAVAATGWATIPGNATASRALASACLTALDLEAA
ncbi:MAG: hypothetical protein EA339_14610 [Rhodobacteraceae bacterium]|nr:MAG: hypothetical protein EA339_14610 [Paracoccaceae bacterium]